MAAPQKQVGITISVPERAKMTLDRQASDRGYSTSRWVNQVFDIGFAAICAREKRMPITDADLDAIVGATLLLRHGQNWDNVMIAKGLGVPPETVDKILKAWREYRRAG